MEPLVELRGVGLTYHAPAGETQALADVSFAVEPGEFISIVGPSGCGKSTLLSLIAGMLRPTQGRVVLRAADGVGYMLQKDHLLEWRSIERNALLGLEIKNRLTAENRAYALELLEQYGLAGFRDRLPAELSGGMRQRVALVRTLALRPGLLLLDEPFSALDYQTRLYIADEIGTIIRREKKTAVLVSHDISEAISLADRVVVLSRRPGTVKNIHTIRLSIPDRTPMRTREAPEFREYFNAIWKELDVHV